MKTRDEDDNEEEEGNEGKVGKEEHEQEEEKEEGERWRHQLYPKTERKKNPHSTSLKEIAVLACSG